MNWKRKQLSSFSLFNLMSGQQVTKKFAIIHSLMSTGHFSRPEGSLGRFHRRSGQFSILDEPKAEEKLFTCNFYWAGNTMISCSFHPSRRDLFRQTAAQVTDSQLLQDVIFLLENHSRRIFEKYFHFFKDYFLYIAPILAIFSQIISDICTYDFLIFLNFLNFIWNFSDLKKNNFVLF
jgi:hypothetical protein